MGETGLKQPLAGLVDEGSFVEHDNELETDDPLDFPGYAAAVSDARERTHTQESVVTGTALIAGRAVEIAMFEFGFFGGSMGEVTGERLARGLERSAREHRPFLLRTATGGARMQEGMRSLAQMPKVVVARMELARAGVPFIALLGHPTTGGVLASLGALADLTFASSGATVGFAGPRVAEAFTGRPLRDDSHTAESALANGLVDDVIGPDQERDALISALALFDHDAPEDLGPPHRAEHPQALDEWEVVQAARSETRLNASEAIDEVCDRFVELRGDRSGTDDRALVAALGRIGGRKAVVLAFDRTRPPAAGAFRKARRCVEIAVRLRLPIVTLVDTRGADPSEESEAQGVAWQIARLFESILAADVPVVSILTGEGGSGGALAFAVGDVLVAYAHSFFSVIGPEGAAQILWRAAERAPEAARALKVSAHDLVRLGIADEVVAEPLSSESLRRVLAYHLDRLAGNEAPGGRPARDRRMRWRSP